MSWAWPRFLLALLVVWSGAAAGAQSPEIAPLIADPVDLQMPSALEEAPDDAAASAWQVEIDALRKRIEELEAGAEADDEKPKEKAAEKPTAPKSDDTEKKWAVKLGGHMQFDFIHWAGTDNAAIPSHDYFEFRRLRLLADGTGYGHYDFRLQIDIEPEGEDTVTSPVVVVKDAYFSANDLGGRFERWRIGNFFVPFSLEQVTNDTNNLFMERSIPTQGIFAADREVGTALYGVNDCQDITWTVGMFIDSISEATKERIDDNQGHRLSGRITWLPYYDEASKGRYLIHTGAGILHTDDQDDLVRFRTRPQIHEGPNLVDTGNVPATDYTSTNVELAIVNGPISVQSELFYTSVDRIAAPHANLYGGYVYLSYFLTGENRQYERFGQHGAQFARTVPNRNFQMCQDCTGPGAWELKTRYSHLNLGELDAGEYNDLTVGCNWYWSDRIRIMFDWIHPVTSTSSTPFGSSTSDIIATRFDVNW